MQNTDQKDPRPTEIGEWVVKSESEMVAMMVAGIQKTTGKLADGDSIERLPGGLYRYRLAPTKQRATRSDKGKVRPQKTNQEATNGSRAS